MLNRGQTLLGISSKGALDADMRDSFDGEVIVSYDKFESSWGQFGDVSKAPVEGYCRHCIEFSF